MTPRVCVVKVAIVPESEWKQPGTPWRVWGVYDSELEAGWIAKEVKRYHESCGLQEPEVRIGWVPLTRVLNSLCRGIELSPAASQEADSFRKFVEHQNTGKAGSDGVF